MNKALSFRRSKVKVPPESGTSPNFISCSLAHYQNFLNSSSVHQFEIFLLTTKQTDKCRLSPNLIGGLKYHQDNYSILCIWKATPKANVSVQLPVSHPHFVRDWHNVEWRFHGLGSNPSWNHRALIYLWARTHQTNRLGRSERTTAEDLAEALASTRPGPSGHSLKSQLSISLVMEHFLKVAKSVMFSALKIEQKFPQKHTIMDD